MRFYSDESMEELLGRLGIYDQPFDYMDFTSRNKPPLKYRFYCDFEGAHNNRDQSIYLPFRVQICDEIVEIIFYS